MPIPDSNLMTEISLAQKSLMDQLKQKFPDHMVFVFPESAEELNIVLVGKDKVFSTQLKLSPGYKKDFEQWITNIEQ